MDDALSYEGLDVYRAATEFLALAVVAAETLRKNDPAIADQFKRASLSIPLNIAEGAGKRGLTDRARFYAIARGSAMECGAVLDVCRILEALDATTIATGKRLLVRIVAMLTRLSQRSPS